MNTINLPARYKRVMEIDLVRNRKDIIIVNVISIFLTVMMFFIGFAIYGRDRISDLIFTDSYERLNSLIFKSIIIIIFCMIVIVVHELIHGIFMKLFCKECKLNFGYRIFYAYAGSNAYYGKKAYNIIAVAPLLIIGITALIACCLAPVEWFWVVYMIEILNVSSAAGDIYVFTIISRMPKDILIRDVGASMTVYGKS